MKEESKNITTQKIERRESHENIMYLSDERIGLNASRDDVRRGVSPLDLSFSRAFSGVINTMFYIIENQMDARQTKLEHSTCVINRNLF